MKELMVHVERIVRPVRAMQFRKLRMRRELLAHLQAAFDEERAAGADETTARQRAEQRLGDPSELTRTLQQTVPWIERTLMMRVPGMSKDAGAFKGLVESVDVYPTMCEVMGVPAPQGLDGKSFATALKNPDGAPKEAFAFQVFPRTTKESGKGWLLGRAMRTDRYRLV